MDADAPRPPSHDGVASAGPIRTGDVARSVRAPSSEGDAVPVAGPKDAVTDARGEGLVPLTAKLSARLVVNDGCRAWCDDHPSAWATKCGWEQKCSECRPCFGTPTSAPTKDLKAPPLCKPFCAPYPKEWWKKCTWWKCGGCQACEDLDNNICRSTELRSEAFENKCIDLYESDTVNGNSIVVLKCDSGRNQRWYFDGGYIRSELNLDKCIAIDGDPATDGAVLIISDCDGNPANRRWSHKKNKSICSKIYTDQCIDIKNSDETTLHIWSLNDQDDKKWNSVCAE